MQPTLLELSSMGGLATTTRRLVAEGERMLSSRLYPRLMQLHRATNEPSIRNAQRELNTSRATTQKLVLHGLVEMRRGDIVPVGLLQAHLTAAGLRWVEAQSGRRAE